MSKFHLTVSTLSAYCSSFFRVCIWHFFAFIYIYTFSNIKMFYVCIMWSILSLHLYEMQYTYWLICVLWGRKWILLRIQTICGINGPRVSKSSSVKRHGVTVDFLLGLTSRAGPVRRPSDEPLLLAGCLSPVAFILVGVSIRAAHWDVVFVALKMKNTKGFNPKSIKSVRLPVQ